MLDPDRQRTMPKVPGINAGTLQPSIGTDHWTLHRRGVRRRSAQLRKAAPISNRGNAWLCPTTGRKRPKPIDRAPFAPEPNRTPAKRRKVR